MFEQIIKSLSLKTYHLKVFVGTFMVIFTMIFLQYLGIKSPQFIIPVPSHTDVFDQVLPHLEERENEYTVKKSTSFIPLAQASGAYEIADAYAVIDFQSGEVILDKNLSGVFPIASLTKIMTAVVALDLASSYEQFTVSKKASEIEPTKIGVLPGQKYTLGELIHGMLLTSANDAAQVIKEGIDIKYNGDVFIRAMNEKAKFLGMNHTHFTNPQGFDVGSPYSTVEDLTILSHYALSNYSLIAEAAAKEYVFLPATSTHPQVDLYNWNGLLGVYPGVSGLKIGNTDKAQKTTIVLSERNGKKLLALLLGAPGVLERDMWTSQLLDEGFSMTIKAKPIEVTENQLREKYATWKYW